MCSSRDDIIAARFRASEFSGRSPGLVHQLSSSEEKIALFRSLFRGREDVYPRRFESRKTGKSGYAPACANEWVRGICEKPRIKCAECPHRRFLPVTDDVIRWHLSGRDDAGQPFVAGVYPMLLDETCFFLAVDFDKNGWLEDARAFMETCRQHGSSGGARAVALRPRRPRVAVLRRGRAGRTRAKARLVHPDRDDGASAGHSASIRTTGYFPIRTRCRTAVSAI